MTHNSGRTSKSEVCTIHKVVRAIAAEKRGMRGLNYFQRNAILERFCTKTLLTSGETDFLANTIWPLPHRRISASLRLSVEPLRYGPKFCDVFE